MEDADAEVVPAGMPVVKAYGAVAKEICGNCAGNVSNGNSPDVSLQS
jgi:hypothetical protein